jgi:hypothetical protein
MPVNKSSSIFLSLFVDLLLLVLYLSNPLDKSFPPNFGCRIILVLLLITTLGFWLKRLYYVLYLLVGLGFTIYYILR